MLHILWVIVKFILILLGVLLGLAIVAVLLLLFCPVRYRVCATKKESDWKQIQGEGKISWLFGGVSLRAEWQGGKSDLSFRLLGFPIDKLLKKKKHTDPAQTEVSKSSSKRTVTDQEVKRQEVQQPKTKKESGDISAEKKISQETQTEKTQIADEDTKREGIWANITQGVQKIRQKIYGVRNTWKKMCSQWTWWKGFLQHPKVKTAFGLVWTHARFLLKHLFPTKIEGAVTFSCEDPAWTGAILALLGMTIPFHKNCVQVTPLFYGGNEVQGNIRFKGRAYGIVFVNAAVRIYFDKNVKYMIKRWKSRRA